MVKIIIATESRYPVNRDSIRAIVNKELEEHHVKGKVELEVDVVGDRKMRDLHAKYMGEDVTTDVLSFPLEDTNVRAPFVVAPDNVLRLGNIVVSYPQAMKEAVEHNLLVDEQIANLVGHGLLHLLGIHHE